MSLSSKVSLSYRHVRCHSETMRVPVVIGHEELGLAVVAIRDLRDDVPQVLQALPEHMNLGGRQVGPKSFIVLGRSRITVALIEPEAHTLVVDHAANEPAVATHGAVHGETEAFHPKAQTLLEIGTRDNGNARLYEHRCLRYSTTCDTGGHNKAAANVTAATAERVTTGGMNPTNRSCSSTVRSGKHAASAKTHRASPPVTRRSATNATITPNSSNAAAKASHSAAISKGLPPTPCAGRSMTVQ